MWTYRSHFEYPQEERVTTAHYDAIVIGAGFAGMTAARELGSRGKRTLVLEAKD
ncbi:FAD-binding protein, partial [Saccharothrix sp. MB29]|nr:FAD-binding protein [Saccharothrix sp. MB29]